MLGIYLLFGPTYQKPKMNLVCRQAIAYMISAKILGIGKAALKVLILKFK